MNADIASIAANRMYAFGETYANAKAWVLANFSTDPSGDGTDLDAVQANITTLGGQALAARAITWYRGNTLFAPLPASSPSVTPVPGFDLTGQDGNVVEVVNGAFGLGAGGGSGLASFGAFGSTPNANGASVVGTVATLQPADNTHPGGISILAQQFAGVKSFSSPLFCNGVAASTGVNGAMLGSVFSTYYGLHRAGASSVFPLAVSDGTDLLLNAPSGIIDIRINTSRKAMFTGTSLDLTGSGTGASIVIKDTLGATRTATIDGTTGLWVIV